jgi:hypothetical protein
MAGNAASEQDLALAQYALDLKARQEAADSASRQEFIGLLGETLPGQIVRELYGAVTLPGDVYAGKVDPRSDEAIKRSFDLAGALTMGAGVVPAGRNEMRMGIKAYHGSPHDFDQFSMSKIGTGEGAQAYGHGLYFAQNEGIAKGYRDALTQPKAILAPDKIKDELAAIGGFSPQAVKMARDELANLGGDAGQTLSMLDTLAANTGYARAKEAASVIRAMNPEQYKGRMYEVELNTTPDRLLDWDKPLREQSPAVIDAYAKARGWSGDNMGKFIESDPGRSGRALYTDMGLASKERDIQAGATSALKDAGIPGIRYLDAGSRAAGDGSRNYVMFDDKLIKILRKYGVATAAALPAAALAELGMTKQEAERTF